MGSMSCVPSADRLAELKRGLAETLVRSGIDTTDEILILGAFLHDFRWKQGFAAQRVHRLWEELFEGSVPSGHFFRLYIHFPYCRQKCLYCIYDTAVAAAPSQIPRYLLDITSEMDYFSPLFSATRFRACFFGGGTPSLLSPAQISSLMETVKRRFQFEEGGLWSIEFNPASTTLAKLKAARRAGFNRISFGVQSLDHEVLKGVNREYQDFRSVSNALLWARRAGFEEINADLVLGFQGETLDSFIAGFKRLAAMRPSTITICSLSMTDAYMRRLGLERESNLRYFNSLIASAMERLRIAGRDTDYLTHELIAENSNWVMRAKDYPKHLIGRAVAGDSYGSGRSSSMLGLGPQARSEVFGKGLYKRDSAFFAPENPLYRLTPMSLKEEMAAFILSALNNSSRLLYSDFERRFGEPLDNKFSLEIEVLSAFGKIRVGSKGMDFLPTHPPERILYAAIFLLDTLCASPFSCGKLAGVWNRR